MQLYRRKGPDWRVIEWRTGLPLWLDKRLETVIKTVWLVSYPALATVVVCWLWYHLLFLRGIHFHESIRDIVLSGWSPFGGVAFALFAALFVNDAWSRYSSQEKSFKFWDTDAFMSLRDENLLPLVHVMMFLVSSLFLGTFMGLKYPDAISGFIIIGSTAFLLLLIYFVVDQLDHRFSGIWFIQDVPRELLEEDPSEWREKKCREKREAFFASLKVVATAVAEAKK